VETTDLVRGDKFTILERKEERKKVVIEYKGKKKRKSPLGETSRLKNIELDMKK